MEGPYRLDWVQDVSCNVSSAFSLEIQCQNYTFVLCSYINLTSKLQKLGNYESFYGQKKFSYT